MGKNKKNKKKKKTLWLSSIININKHLEKIYSRLDMLERNQGDASGESYKDYVSRIEHLESRTADLIKRISALNSASEENSAVIRKLAAYFDSRGNERKSDSSSAEKDSLRLSTELSSLSGRLNKLEIDFRKFCSVTASAIDSLKSSEAVSSDTSGLLDKIVELDGNIRKVYSELTYKTDCLNTSIAQINSRLGAMQAANGRSDDERIKRLETELQAQSEKIREYEREQQRLKSEISSLRSKSEKRQPHGEIIAKTEEKHIKARERPSENEFSNTGKLFRVERYKDSPLLSFCPTKEQVQSYFNEAMKLDGIISAAETAGQFGIAKLVGQIKQLIDEKARGFRYNKLDSDEYCEEAIACVSKPIAEKLIGNAVLSLSEKILYDPKCRVKLNGVIAAITDYLGKIGYYTIDVSPGRNVDEYLSCMNPTACHTDVPELDKIIKEVTVLPYYVDYYDDEGTILSRIIAGKCSVFTTKV